MEKASNLSSREWFKLQTGRNTYLVYDTSEDFDKIIENDRMKNGDPEYGYPMEPVCYTEKDLPTFAKWGVMYRLSCQMDIKGINMRKFLNGLSNTQIDILRNSFQSSLGDDYAVLSRPAIIDKIVEYCKNYAINSADLKSRYFT